MYNFVVNECEEGKNEIMKEKIISNEMPTTRAMLKKLLDCAR